MHKPMALLVRAWGAVLPSPGSTSPCLCAQPFFSAPCSGSCRRWGLGKRHLNHVAFSLAHLLLTRNRREPSVGSVATFHPAAACRAQAPFSEEQQKGAQPKTHRDVFPYGSVGGKTWGLCSYRGSTLLEGRATVLCLGKRLQRGKRNTW